MLAEWAKGKRPLLPGRRKGPPRPIGTPRPVRKWAFVPGTGYDPLRPMPRTFSGYPRKLRRDWGRLVAQLCCLLFGAIGAVPLCIGLLVRTAVVRSWAARETAVVLERELGLLARYGVQVEAWPFSVSLSDVVVEGSDGLGPALEVVRIAVRPRLFSLLGGRLDAGHIEIDGPRARLVVNEGELRNVRYHLPKTKERTPSRRAPFAYGPSTRMARLPGRSADHNKSSAIR